MSASSAMETALRLLTTRDRSVADLRRRLQQKGFDEASVEQTLRRCRELGYLDDARFAEARVRSLMRNCRAVGPRLLQDLRQQGIPDDQAQRATEEAAAEFDHAQLIRELLERRFTDFEYELADDRQKRRVVNFFLRRGFSLGLVLSILKQER